MSQPDFDVGIIGGGPAGSGTAAYLAKAGLRCVLFERELFPRQHVGESLVPSSTRVFAELDFLKEMDKAGFPRKYGAVWTASSKSPAYSHDWEGLALGDHADIRFDERRQEGVERNYTYHVDRGIFDLMLLQHAHRLGAEVYEGVRVKGVDFSDPDVARVLFSIGSRDCDVGVRMVVDASGRQTLLGTQQRLKVNDPVFDQYALHTWFEDYDRRMLASREGQEGYIFVHFLPMSNSWIWQIPISNRITSIGVVTQRKNFSSSRRTREDFFWDCIRTRPELYEGLKAAEQIRPIKDEADYSYAMKAICGDRFVLVGDAARFVDPIFSTGVSIALNGARLASKDIVGAAERGDFRKQSFRTFEETVRRGTKNWYEFITVYYRLNVLFTAFIQDRRYRLDVLKLLQGDVYDVEQPEVLTLMNQIVSEVEQNQDHIWHSYLGDLTASAFRPA